MKTNLFVIFILSGLFIFGCKDDNSLKKEDLALNSFEKMFPEARDASWGTKDGYLVVEFKKDNKGNEAWFDNQGVWYLTKVEIQFEDLPVIIKEIHKSGKYTSWKVEDVDKIERKDRETLYIIEVEKNDIEYDLYYSENGKLVREETSTSNPSYFPIPMSDKIKSYITEKYPSAKILEIETEKDFIEVDVLDNTVHKELIFNLKEEWICTKKECAISEIPSIVIAKLNSQDYAIEQVDEVKYIDEAQKSYYQFEIEYEGVENDIIIKITPKGEILK